MGFVGALGSEWGWIEGQGMTGYAMGIVGVGIEGVEHLDVTPKLVVIVSIL